MSRNGERPKTFPAKEDTNLYQANSHLFPISLLKIVYSIFNFFLDNLSKPLPLDMTVKILILPTYCRLDFKKLSQYFNLPKCYKCLYHEIILGNILIILWFLYIDPFLLNQLRAAESCAAESCALDT